VINISTGLSRVAAPYQVPYVAMKAALNSVALSLAPILGAQDDTINAVMPGYVETDRMQESFAQPGRRKLVSSLSVFNRIGTPDDVAQMVRYLASEGARWTTGQVIDTTGGAAWGGGG
jgi:3-oxoacyl-[acyl-carrier protein] reductase